MIHVLFSFTCDYIYIFHLRYMYNQYEKTQFIQLNSIYSSVVLSNNGVSTVINYVILSFVSLVFYLFYEYLLALYVDIIDQCVDSPLIHIFILQKIC